MSAIELPSSYANRSPGERIVAAVAALVITGLILLMLFELGIIAPEPPPGGTTAVMLNLQPGQKQAQTTKAPAKAKSAAHKAVTQQAHSHVAPKPVVTPPPAAAQHAPWNVIWMSHDQMAAADISNLPSHHDERAAADASGSGSADGAGSAGGAGGAPGPDHLFDADWYRRPTRAEMDTYMPHDMTQSGWGMVACKTAPDYRVEDCREIDESPGSHIARAVREASWQFRVMPPRVNGKPLIGAWVRIRFDVDVHGGAEAN